MKKYLIGLASLFAMFSVFGLASPKAQAETTVKIASDNAYAPFEFQNSNKEWVGIDVDLIKAVAKENNWKLDISFPGFDTAVNQLQSGQADGVIAGMSITDERKNLFDFSKPYYSSALTIATTKAKPISDYSELKGKTVGVKNGTAAQSWLQSNQSKYGYEIKTYSDGTHMYSALSSGNIVGVMDEVPVISYAITQGQDLAINLPAISLPGGYGFAVAKGKNAQLVKDFNKTLAQMKANGDYQKIVDKYTKASTKKATPKKEVYNIYSDNSFAPFEFQNSDKQYTGIDVDLLNAIAKDQGFTIKWNFVGFDAAVNALQAGQADAAMAGMSITDARKEVFNFSDAYYQANVTVAARKDEKIKSWEDLKGKTVGAKNGTVSYTYLTENKDKYGYKVKTFSDATSMYQSLQSGSIDAVMDDEPVIQYAIKQGQNMVTPLKAVPAGTYGFAVKKGSNPELIEMFNNGLADIKANGTYDQIKSKYLATGNSNNGKKTVSEKTLWGIIYNNWQQIAKGLLVTLELAVISFVLAVIVGVIFGFMSVSPSKLLRGIARVYVDLNRSIPLLVLIFFLFFGIPNLMQSITGQQSPINEFVAGVIALTLNESSYIAEIFRGGVNAVPLGQTEASRSLGVSYLTTMRKVVLPQAVKITTPSLINQFIITLKDTTLVSTIGLVELLQAGQIIVARNFQGFRVYGLIGLIYIIILLILMYVGRLVERRIK
ncbi:amino acid ABC transporter substrate-binding protein/permease [Lactococcus termiticola]|uniref:Glutamine ABC transporter permease protein with duplicated glutamine-binding domain n=1 Tax=Lactococcus termiticola TaxID=2169526 RepID=A0A2R5HDY3_9LACT|nr:amino acid ABC transporter substrate-binding protein/permease [Lactococcus termiticola]GBG96294.1 glutamine ABC transporter permease protein with duplicated glutamine-binding domain [Lactococcus termiticola]